MSRKDGERFYRSDRARDYQPRGRDFAAHSTEYCAGVHHEKYVYRDLEAAKTALTTIKFSRATDEDFAQKHREIRAYYCGKCGGYHLTSEEDGQYFAKMTASMLKTERKTRENSVENRETARREKMRAERIDAIAKIAAAGILARRERADFGRFAREMGSAA